MGLLPWTAETASDDLENAAKVNQHLPLLANAERASIHGSQTSPLRPADLQGQGYHIVPRPWLETTHSRFGDPKSFEELTPMQRWEQESMREQGWNNVATVFVDKNEGMGEECQEGFDDGGMEISIMDSSEGRQSVEVQDGGDKA